MTLYNIITQMVGLVGVGVLFISFQLKDSKKYCAFQAIGCALFSLNFLLLHSYPGFVLNLINIPRGILFSLDKKYQKPYLVIIIMLFYVLFTIFTYTGVLSIFLLVASIVSTLTMWYQNTRIIHFFQFFLVSPIWITNNILAGSIGGIVGEIFNFTSVLLFEIRLYIAKKNKKH